MHTRRKNERQVPRLRLSSRNLNCGVLDELAERRGNFHESARVLVRLSPDSQRFTRKTDQSMNRGSQVHVSQIAGRNEQMIWNAVTTQSRKGLHVKTTRNAHRGARSETMSDKTLSSSRDAG